MRQNRRPNRAFKQLLGESLEPRHLLAGVFQHGPTALEYNNVGYFLRTDTPRIERYDLTNETWLSPITLAGASGTPTAELVDANGIYVAYGQAVYRYQADGSGQTHLMNTTGGVSAIHSDGNLLFLNYSSGLYARYISIDKTTNTVIDTHEQYVDSVYGSSISVETNRILGRSSGISPSDITYISYDDTGNFTGGGNSPYHGSYPGASRVWVFPGGMKVVDSSGTLYSSDSLTWLKSFGTSITDVGFSGNDIPITLSGQTLTAYTSTILPSGSVTLPYSPVNVFVNARDAITFTVDASSATKLRADLVPLSSLQAPTPGQAVNPVGLSYTPDKVELAADGTLLLFSKANQSIFRWNPSTQSYGATIPLLGVPSYMAYSGTNNTIYLAYSSGLIRKIDLGAATLSETPFATLATGPGGLSTAGKYVFAEDGSGAWGTHYTFAPDGTKIDSVDWNYYSSEYIWNDANQKMYFFRDDTSPNDLLWEEINASGTAYPGEVAGGIRGKLDSPLHDSSGFSHPIRVAPDGSIVVLGSGVIHDAKTLARLSTALSSSIVDAAWLNGELFTIAGGTGTTAFQHWSKPTYGLDKVLQVSGTPKALLAVSSSQLVGIALDAKGVPVFTVLDANLTPVTTSRQLTFSLAPGVVAENLPSASTVGTFTATDSETGHTYTYSLVAGTGDTDNAAFAISGNTLKTTKAFDFETKATYSIRVRILDNAGFPAEKSLNVTVSNVNEAPTAASNAYSIEQGKTLMIAGPGVLANDSDIDGDALQALVETQPTHGTLTLSADGGFVYTPAATYTGSDKFTYRASDATLSSASATVSLTVTPSLDIPVALGDSYTMVEDTPRTVAAPGILGNDTGPIGIVLSVALETSPTHGTLTLNTDGSFSYSPATNYSGTDKFTYRAINGTHKSAITTVSLTISAVNDAPIAVDDNYVATQNTALLVNAKGVLTNDSDVDSATLTAVIGAGPSNGTLTLNSNGSFTYTPTAGYIGSDSFTYFARDASLLSASPATVSILVKPATSPNNELSTREDDSLYIAVSSLLPSSTDTAGNALSVLLAVGGGPAHGSLTMLAAGETLVYTPHRDFQGNDQFVYYVSNGAAISSSSTVSIAVTPVNDAPNFAKGADQYSTDQSGPQQVVAWAKNISPGPANESGQSVHFVVVSNSNAGLFSVPPAIDATGNLTFTPQENIVGLAEIRVMLADDGGTDNGGRDQSDIQTFFIQIGFAFPLHNRAMPADVTGDNNVVAEDVLRVINYINAYGAGPVSANPELGAIALALAEAEEQATRYYDVTGDDYIAADDAIAIINFINSQSRNETPTAEGEAAPTRNDVLMLLATDVASQRKRQK